MTVDNIEWDVENPKKNRAIEIYLGRVQQLSLFLSLSPPLSPSPLSLKKKIVHLMPMPDLFRRDVREVETVKK